MHGARHDRRNPFQFGHGCDVLCFLRHPRRASGCGCNLGDAQMNLHRLATPPTLLPARRNLPVSANAHRSFIRAVGSVRGHNCTRFSPPFDVYAEHRKTRHYFPAAYLRQEGPGTVLMGARLQKDPSPNHVHEEKACRSQPWQSLLYSSSLVALREASHIIFGASRPTS